MNIMYVFKQRLMFLNESCSSQRDSVLTAKEVIKVFYSYLKKNGTKLNYDSDSKKLLFIMLDKNDPIVKFINTQVVEVYSSRDLWKLIQPCLETLVFEDVGICLLSQDTPQVSQELASSTFCQYYLQPGHKKIAKSYKPTFSSSDSGFYDLNAVSEPPIKLPRISSQDLGSVDSIDSSQKLFCSKNSAIDNPEVINCEIPSFKMLGRSCNFLQQANKTDNTLLNDCSFYESSESPNKLPRMASQDLNFLLSPPTKSVYFYLRPRSEINSKEFSVSNQDDNYSLCSTVEIGNVSLDSFGQTSMRVNCKNAKIIDDEISENYGSKDMNEFKVKLNELIKVNSNEKTTDYYDDYPEKLKYESQYKPGWRCDQCILGFENTDFAAFCLRCNSVRPFLMHPYPVDKDQSFKLDRPDRLQISNPKPTTSNRFFWIFSRPLGNINLWNLLSKNKPYLNFNQSVKSVAVPNISRFSKYADRSIKYPMFVIPEVRNQEDFEDVEYNLPPVLDYDEIEQDDCVTIAYGINPCICKICMDRPIDTLLLHKKENVCHACCEGCANKDSIKEICPFCKEEVFTIMTVDFFSTATGVVL